jgi:hypothetical protein
MVTTNQVPRTSSKSAKKKTKKSKGLMDPSKFRPTAEMLDMAASVFKRLGIETAAPTAENPEISPDIIVSALSKLFPEEFVHEEKEDDIPAIGAVSAFSLMLPRPMIIGAEDRPWKVFALVSHTREFTPTIPYNELIAWDALLNVCTDGNFSSLADDEVKVVLLLSPLTSVRDISAAQEWEAKQLGSRILLKLSHDPPVNELSIRQVRLSWPLLPFMNQPPYTPHKCPPLSQVDEVLAYRTAQKDTNIMLFAPTVFDLVAAVSQGLVPVLSPPKDLRTAMWLCKLRQDVPLTQYWIAAHDQNVGRVLDTFDQDGTLLDTDDEDRRRVINPLTIIQTWSQISTQMEMLLLQGSGQEMKLLLALIENLPFIVEKQRQLGLCGFKFEDVAQAPHTVPSGLMRADMNATLTDAIEKEESLPYFIKLLERAVHDKKSGACVLYPQQ